ncbi:MAG: EthD family reductase [Proteobacteria bacterium]|nr:EthD family reductase [Pseudomonadota bacterium]
MTTVIVLFNLKPGASVADYERFARETDLPIVNKLPSVERFEVLKTAGLLGGGDAPYQYVEVLRLKSLEALGQDVATEQMKNVAAEFRVFADNPQFILTETL